MGETRDITESAVRSVLWNAANYPGRVQAYILGEDIGPLSGKVTDAILASDAIRRIKAEAWDEGHKRTRRTGANQCRCEAWSPGECACGEYGNGKLLSLKDNPYRTEEKS